MKVHFIKAKITTGHLNILFLPTVAYARYDNARWKYQHCLIFGWLCWTYAICIE